MRMGKGERAVTELISIVDLVSGLSKAALGAGLYRSCHACRIVLRSYLDRKVQRGGGERHYGEVFLDGGFHEKDWLEVERELTRMAELTRDAGVAFAVAYIPSPEIAFAIAEYPPARVSRWGARVGVQVIDALPAMRRATRNTPTNWDDDIHCTPAGYGVIAQVLFDELSSSGLVP